MEDVTQKEMTYSTTWFLIQKRIPSLQSIFVYEKKTLFENCSEISVYLFFCPH